MQSTRLTTRLPRTLKIVKVPASTCTTRKMSLFPRFVSHDFPRFVANDFAPVWRLLDDYANQSISARNGDSATQRRSFNPRFDVREVEGAYELKGELPGVDQKDVEIEFPDQQTIVIKGSTGYSREQGTPQAQTQEQEQAEAVEATPSETSHQATVEDEPEIIESNPEAAESAEPTPAATPETQVQQASASQVTQPSGHYWVSERYTGSFQRSFGFPAPVDTDNAKATLKNGVLEVTIPKLQKAGIKRIAIQ